VNAGQFGKLGAPKGDGAVYAQPLFVSAVEIPGKGKHDVLERLAGPKGSRRARVGGKRRRP
jgi:hypothetical protein